MDRAPNQKVAGSLQKSRYDTDTIHASSLAGQSQHGTYKMALIYLARLSNVHNSRHKFFGTIYHLSWLPLYWLELA